MSATGQGV